MELWFVMWWCVRLGVTCWMSFVVGGARQPARSITARLMYTSTDTAVVIDVHMYEYVAFHETSGVVQI